MSAIPAFEIGVWNAWTFMAYQMLTVPFLFWIAGKRGTTSDEKLELSIIQRVIASFTKILIIPALAYSIFLPLKLGTTWFYVGLPVTLLGLVTSTIALVNWASTRTNTPITRGLYRFSRHPMYIADFIFFLGLGIATAS